MTSEMIDAASEGKLDLLYAAGGNFLEVMPDPENVDQALSNIPLRVHQDIVLSGQMLVEPGRYGGASAGGDPVRDTGRA